MKNISGTITSGGTAQVLSAGNNNRRYLLVQNISDITMWVNELGVATADTPSIQLVAGASLELVGPQAAGAWSIIGATTGKKFVAREA